jgi:NDP-sugar pyrophosphorylase family protein
MNLAPGLFFELSSYEHRELYGEGEPVWAALTNLAFYVGSLIAQRATGPYRSCNQSAAALDSSVRISQPSEVLIAPGAVIKAYTVIEGPVIIDEGAVIGPHAYIRGPAIIGREARVGHCSEIKRSILFPGSKAPHRNSILDSLLGWNVNVGGHLVTANLRGDRRTIVLKLPNGRIDTGLRKLGIIAGDRSFFGCAVHFNPGDHFMPDTRLT